MSGIQQTDLLIPQLQNGSEKAFAAVYDMYADSLYGLILKIVRDDGLAQDILQDCFVTIWKKSPTYDSKKGTFFTWMLNICRNRAIDALRRSQRLNDYQNEVKNTQPEFAQSSGFNIDTIGMKEMLTKLTTEEQLVLDYLYFRGYTQQELSDELGIPLGTVKMRARNALIELRGSFISILLLWILKNT